MRGPIDSHCHLQSLTPDEREAALDAARERGVSGFLVPAIELDDAELLLELCHRHDDVWCALGCHPHQASSWRDGDGERLRGLLADPKAVAVGECGLDFHYDISPRDVQIRVMREQWQLAVELDLPVVVHNRESNDEMLEVARSPDFADLRADFHSYAGGVEMARELLEHGFYLGMSGMVTFRLADNVREVLEIAPTGRLLVETDTPYLAPVPYRGKPNRPAYVVEILERIAQEIGITAQEAAAATCENFFRLFDRAGSDEALGSVV
ncbi:MAG: TatD family hydrolase [bacterium]|nr:TatD family hydrolase [bacterium]